jgi:kynureninase
MVEIEPDDTYYVSTARVLATIDAHADSAALILLPGLQYWTGQLFDMQAITAHARARGLVVGWDLAHCVGNVPLALHDWGADFAAWCNYKYLNAGPGAIGGAFIHERHGGLELDGSGAERPQHRYRPRLTGWYGGDKSVRFNMDKTFQPTPGAAGFQLSNPSGIDLACLSGALSVFGKVTMDDLRRKSLQLTGYAEFLLNEILEDERSEVPGFKIITPTNPDERGAQLCLLMRSSEVQAGVGAALKEAGVVTDQRKPDVIRVSPVPMYNTFEEVWKFMDVFRKALGVGFGK